MKFYLVIFVLFLISRNVFPQEENLVEFTSSNLPIVVINTNGQTIPNDNKIMADMGIIYNQEGARNYMTDPFNHYNGKIGIEIRGSTSQMFPKKQYAVETRDASGNDSTVSLLGFPAEDDWVFFAPYNDKSLIRDALTYQLARDMNRYASRSKYFELVINGDYKGVYVLFEKIKRDVNRVNIKKLNPTDITGDALTGGYIIKIDKPDGENNDGWYSGFFPFPQSTKRIFYQYHYPKSDEIVNQQKNYIMNFINAFEGLMSGVNFNDSIFGYHTIIDVDSFIDFILINELVRNVDAYRLSTYFYKNRNSINPKLFAGPIWDFNLAFGNANYYDGFRTSGFSLAFLSNYQNMSQDEDFLIPFWWKKLFDDTNFQNRLHTRWLTLRSTAWANQKIFNYIDSLTTLLDESKSRNFQRWNVLGQWVWPNYFVGQTYQEEINYLKNWITQRLNWLDNNMVGTPNSINDNNYSPSQFILEQNYPNPFNPTTKIKFSIPYVETRPTSNFRQAQGITSSIIGVSLRIYDIVGKEIATLINQEMLPGVYEIEFDGSQIPSGVYFYQLSTGKFISTKKFVLLK